jgi:hypothetical protein
MVAMRHLRRNIRELRKRSRDGVRLASSSRSPGADPNPPPLFATASRCHQDSEAGLRAKITDIAGIDRNLLKSAPGGNKQANIGDQAAPAFGFACLADIAPVQDQPMVAVVLVAIRNDAQQFELDV